MSDIVLYSTVTMVHTRPTADDHASALSVSDGSWAQLHLFLEVDCKNVGAGKGEPARSQCVLHNFRLVAWVIDTGVVIVNDKLCGGCTWQCLEETLWQLSTADGHCYAFQFRTREQAGECAQLIGNVLTNMEEIRRLVKKVFQTRSTTRDFLSLLNDIGFFKLDVQRRSTMIQSAHAAVSSLQVGSEWRSQRKSAPPVYPIDRASLVPPGSEYQQFAETMRSVDSTAMIEQMTLDEFIELQPHSSDTDGDDLGCPLSFESTNDITSEEVGVAAEIDSVLQMELMPDTSPSANRISMPYKTRQELHVTYNAEFARYEGLPWAWRRINRQFGLPLEAVPKRRLAAYASKIPAVLQMMRENLLASDGLKAEGIFRLAPGKEKCAAVKEMIDDGTFTGCVDVHIIANLIKMWFRELPESLFNVIPEKHIYSTCDLKEPNEVMKSMDAFPPLHRDLMFWLLDLMVDVVDNEEYNKMSARNMSIVIAPNLFTISSDNPMYALTMSQKVAEFTYVLLDSRRRYLNP